MVEEDWTTRMRRIEREEKERLDARYERRAEFRRKLFGTDDAVAMQTPPPVEDYDAMLGQHAAQLKHAIGYTMGYALSDDVSLKDHAQVVASLTRMIQANIVIARTLGASRETSKTVHGVARPKDAQD